MSTPSDKRRLRAVALSGLVLPGAGQLHLGARVRGVLLIAASVVLLGLFVVVCVDAVFDAVRSAPAGLDWELASEVAARHRGRLVSVLLGLLVVWVVAIVDAWFAVGIAKRSTSGDTEGRSQPGRAP